MTHEERATLLKELSERYAARGRALDSVAKAEARLIALRADTNIEARTISARIQDIERTLLNDPVENRLEEIPTLRDPGAVDSAPRG